MDTFGRVFRVSIFGESHGDVIGAVIDGVLPGMPLSPGDFAGDILRRKSGAAGTTPRTEADVPEILSGVYRGRTTGAPLTIVFRNGDVRSEDYCLFTEVPRPGHADYTANVKWTGYNDPRGGGHFSGRLTLPVVAAGVVAKKMCLCSVSAELIEVGGVSREAAMASSAVREAVSAAGEGGHIPDNVVWKEVLAAAMAEADSVGGVVECRITDVPAGIGEPFFDSVESLISHAVFSIPGVRGIEFGDGFAASRMRGSEHNDPFVRNGGNGRDGVGIKAIPMRNGAGGVNGGITNGSPVVFRVAFKPTSSIGKAQETLDLSSGKMVTLKVPGRHDTCFALRTPPIVEAMAAIVMADLVKMR